MKWEASSRDKYITQTSSLAHDFTKKMKLRQWLHVPAEDDSEEKEMRGELFTHLSFDNGGLSLTSSSFTSSSSEVSTDLVLYDESWEKSRKRKSMEDPIHSDGSTVECSTTLARNIERMKFYSEKEEEEERRLGLSTRLKLFEEPWKIRKKLKSSDVGNLCRLLLQTETVKAHILPYLDEDQVKEVESMGSRFKVMDDDTKTIHHLVLKKWRTSKSYVLIEGWSQGFVKRRELKEGDEVGIFWDSINSMFNFTVIHRASPICKLNP